MSHRFAALQAVATAPAVHLRGSPEHLEQIAAHHRRLLSRIEGVETAPIGTRVKARISELNGEPAIVFDVIGAGGGA